MEPRNFPPQHQDQPGHSWRMNPVPETDYPDYQSSFRLRGRTALITGGDSGIGQATALLFAREGADVVIVYANEHEDARYTIRRIEEIGARALALPGDVGEQRFCREAVERTVEAFGGIDILVNNAGEQHVRETLEEIDDSDLERTFRTNIFSMFYMVKYALPYLKKGSAVINTTSVTAYEGNPYLIDYSATKGAIVAFTRSLAKKLADRDIRVNAVAPGPIWTPLIPASFSAEHVKEFGTSTLMKRAGEPREVAPCYLFLASRDSSYMTGQVLHPNGGRIVNG
ncbi:MAG: SDR family oxidoreductase [Chitinispirillaceae bacterium]